MLKEIKNIFSYNMGNMLKFEFIFKIASAILFTPLFLGLFNLILRVTGYKYLTFENVVSFLSNPITIVAILLLLLLITIYSLFDLGVIITLIDASYQKKNVSLIEVIKYSFKKSIATFQPKNMSIMLLVLFLIPFLNIGVGTSFISSISIPEFILDYIRSNAFLSILYLLLIIFLITLLLRWIYSLHYYFLEGCNFKEARKKSIALGKKNHGKDLLKILVTQFLLTLLYFLSIFVGIFLIVVIYSSLKKVMILNTILITIVWFFIAISFMITVVISNALGYSIISILYYKHKIKNHEEIKTIDLSSIEKKNVKKEKNVLNISLVCIILIGLAVFTNGVMMGKYNLNIEYIRNMEVTAHRGASVQYPENTLLAFQKAKELGADWVELDVQQTKDGKLIIMHDTNFKRTTGVDLNTWQASYEQVMSLDAGSFKGKEFKGEKIPLLEEVIAWAKENNMKLNIELKPTGNETDFEKMVVSVIKENHFTDSCVITSQVYEVLENVKKVDSSITTVYVMSLAYGNIKQLDKADYFSIESSSITEKLVREIHEEGKQIYGWTVNTEKNIHKMIDLNVDNIITDDIELAKRLVYESKTSNVITEYIKWVENLF